MDGMFPPRRSTERVRDLLGSHANRRTFQGQSLPSSSVLTVHSSNRLSFLQFDYRIRHRDGNMRWNVCHGRPKKDAEGNVLGWVASIFDQEDVVQARHDALLTQKRIKAVLEASRQFSVFRSRSALQLSLTR